MEKKYTFSWGYALHKALTFCTSAKNISITTATLYALTNYQMTEPVQAAIVMTSVWLMAMFRQFGKK